ncbi:MAG: hypothetical protein IPK32_04795 [Verrucomicrobiaceae bacterium]|nr:hypothetical protein [Verrucomicrobiaceae bacterium]
MHIDINLDVESISHTLSALPELKNEAMSLAQKLRNEGRVEGRVEGRQEGRLEGQDLGVWSGKIEQFLGLQSSGTSVLMDMEISALETRFRELEAQYNARFKK